LGRQSERGREARKIADEREREAEIAAAELRALQRASELRPHPIFRPGAFSGLAPRPSGHKGRQPGAISKNWQIILLAMALRHPAGATEQDIVAIAQDESIEALKNLRPRDAARQMHKYEEIGYVEIANQLTGSWRITETALRRFNIQAAASPPQEAETATDLQSAAASESSSAERV
jgi:hypothetical protein